MPAAPTAPSPASAPAVRSSFARLCRGRGRDRALCLRLFENGFLCAFVHFLLDFIRLFFRKFCNDWLHSGHRLAGGFADGCASDNGRRYRDRRAQACLLYTSDAADE